VQKLSLVSLTWELKQFRLQFGGFGIPCFKVRDTEVYLVVNKTLCLFTASEVRPLKTLIEVIQPIVERVTTAEALSPALIMTEEFSVSK
jgi:hypothetical protein